MTPRLLVRIADCLVEPLCNIYTSSISDGVVPLDWRRANVCPAHKKGSRVVAGNYRPISLTSQLCKVFEFIMRDELIGHLEKLHLIYHESQHGFCRGRSCLSNLLTFLEKATKAVDDGLSLDVIYLDLAKAYIYNIAQYRQSAQYMPTASLNHSATYTLAVSQME